jgi:prepilin-type N-terminal cleavage/methylation domain-containing protein
MNGCSNIKHQGTGRREDNGFTLVEILIAIVLVGILSAVVVVGISSLTNKGAKSACAASLDAAKAGSVVYFTTQNAYPATLRAMTLATTGANAAPAALELPTGVVVGAAAVVAPLSPAAGPGMQARAGTGGTTWQLTMTNGAPGAKPTFVCTP